MLFAVVCLIIQFICFLVSLLTLRKKGPWQGAVICGGFFISQLIVVLNHGHYPHWLNYYYWGLMPLTLILFLFQLHDFFKKRAAFRKSLKEYQDLNMSDIIEDLEKIMFMGNPMYYRRDGTPYKDFMEWAADFERPRNAKDWAAHRRVALTKLWWGATVSTVWLGLDHSFGGGPPLIFETMVFPPRSMGDLDIDRYSTEAQALAGHKAMCKRWRFPLIPLISHWFDGGTWRIKMKISKWRRSGK